MLITSPYSISLGHFLQRTISEENAPSKTIRDFKKWCWKLIKLCLENNLINATTSLLTDTETA